MDVFVTLLVALIVSLFTAFYFYFHKYKDYWRERGVPCIQPKSLFKRVVSIATSKNPHYFDYDSLYEAFKRNGCGGYMEGRRPALLVCDPELIKMVLTKDFGSFHDRDLFFGTNDDLAKNLFFVEGAEWKYLRTKLSPVFTSGKMKTMFPLMAEVEDELKSVIKNEIKDNQEIELKDILLRFSTDIIGTTAFGVNCNSLKYKDSEFHKMALLFVRGTKRAGALILLSFISTTVAKLITPRMLFGKIVDFFANFMEQTIEHRKKNNVVRNDFVHLMMQLQETDKNQPKPENFIEFTNNVITAQGFFFFTAGLDAMPSIIGFALGELAQNPELQEKASQQIKLVLAKSGGQWTYDSLKDMDLLERILLEAMRMYPPTTIIMRKRTSPLYTIPGTKFTLDKTPKVMVPVWQLHYDPDIYPDPERFDPDRFTEEAKQTRHPYAYLPFGEGPRVCIAQRFAMMELMLCLGGLLEEFKFSAGEKTEVKPQLDMWSFSPTQQNGIWLKVQERK